MSDTALAPTRLAPTATPPPAWQIGNHYAALRTKLDRGLESAYIGVCGDSTGSGSGNPTRWVYYFAQYLAAAYPAYAVNFRPWNVNTNSYDATIVVQAGTGTGNAGGPFTVEIYNGSASGQTPVYSRTWLINVLPTSVVFDLVFVNHGHNVFDTPDVQTVQRFYQLGRDLIRFSSPNCALIFMGQNPRMSPASGPPAHLQRINRVAEMCANERWGFVNVTQLFLDHPTWQTDWMISDGAHPSDAGSLAWATLVWSQFQQSGEYGVPNAALTNDFHLFVPAAQFVPSLIVAGAPAAPAQLGNVLPVVAYSKQSGVYGASAIIRMPPSWRLVNFWLYWTVNDSTAGNVAWRIDNMYLGRVGLDLGSGTTATPLSVSAGSDVTGAAPGAALAQSHTLISQLLNYTGDTRSRTACLRVCRDGAAVADTYPNTAYLYGLLVERAA